MLFRSHPMQLGRMDFCIMKDEANVSIICECKSTQNLILPMTANACVKAYTNAYAKGLNTSQRSLEWSNVAHPIGQVLNYMISNNHPCGALTSGTRTYFIKIQKPEDTGSIINPGHQAQRSDVPVDRMATRSQANKGNTNNDVDHGTTQRSVWGNHKFASRSKKNHPSKNDNDGWDNEIKVYISDAWFVGEANYLRAWAYMHTLSNLVEPLRG